jgi:hypothetical protein
MRRPRQGREGPLGFRGVSVRKRDRSEEVDRAAGKVVFPVGVRSAVLCASGAWCPNGPGGHARTSRVNTQASVLRWVVGRGGRGVFSASGPLPQLNLHRLHSAVFSRWDVESWVGLVLAMSFERTGLPCVLIHCIRPHALSLTVGEVLVECVCTLACGAWSL